MIYQILCVFSLCYLAKLSQFSAPLRSPFPLSGWTVALHAGTCSPYSSLLVVTKARAYVAEYYKSHFENPPSAPLSHQTRDRYGTDCLDETPLDFQNQKPTEISGLQRRRSRNAKFAHLPYMLIISTQDERVGGCFCNLTSLSGSLITFWNYSVL